MVDIITVPKYLCHKWPRICYICRNQNPVLSREITIALSVLPWFTAYCYFVSSTFSLWYIYVFPTTTESQIPLLVDYQFPKCRPPSSQYFDCDIVLVMSLYDKPVLIRVHNLFFGIDSVWYMRFFYCTPYCHNLDQAMVEVSLGGISVPGYHPPSSQYFDSDIVYHI